MELDVKVLKSKRLFIATPMYGGQCAGLYTKSVNDLTAICTKYGISVRHYYMFNESLITRARNYCVDEFLRSDCTHMLFIDSDIGFNYRDALTLLFLTDSDAGKDIVTGPYPKKTLAWEKIKKACDLGYGNENPFDLSKFGGDYVFNTIEGMKSFQIKNVVEIKEGGTGFMCVDRKAFEKYAEKYPELRYIPDHVRTDNFDGSHEITAFFDTMIEPLSRRYLSEDYMFSNYARKIGLSIYMCPWMQLEHVGSYTFGGSLGHIAMIDASPTASAESSQKHYEKGEKDLTTDEKSSINKPTNRRKKRK